MSIPRGTVTKFGPGGGLVSPFQYSDNSSLVRTWAHGPNERRIRHGQMGHAEMGHLSPRRPCLFMRAWQLENVPILIFGIEFQVCYFDIVKFVS